MFFLPVRDQFVERSRLEDGPRLDVGAHLRALLEQADGEIGVDLLQPDRRGKAGGACTHDADPLAFQRGIAFMQGSHQSA